MANTVVVSSSLLAATASVLFLFLSVCTPTSEAAPFFLNMPEMSNLIQMPDLPRIEMPDIRYVLLYGKVPFRTRFSFRYLVMNWN